jgi:Major tropism determinant N-terminal domain/Repeat of unknown function (DUF5907)
MANIFLFRRKTEADWTSANPVLMAGELGLETDTARFKFGNGATAWNSLPYSGSSGGSAIWGSITGTLSSQADLVAALAAKQATLVSGTTIKTLNGSTILGSGDLVISASVADGDKGDITVSGSGATWTIDAGAVTLAKMANMATASLIYRKTAGSGVPEVNTLATLKTDLGLTGTNSGDQTITLTSDVTGSGTGSFATTIANNAVTLAKMQDFTTDVLLGRDTAGSGDPELIGVGGGVEFNGAGSIRTSAFTGDVTKTAGGTALTIAADAVTNTQLANMAANTVKVRAAATTGDPSDLALAASQLLGRGASGDIAPIVLGTNLSMTGTTLNASGGGGGSITVQDEGSNITTALGTLNFVGAGVTVTGGATATVTIPGGGGGAFDYGINAAMTGMVPY